MSKQSNNDFSKFPLNSYQNFHEHINSKYELTDDEKLALVSITRDIHGLSVYELYKIDDNSEKKINKINSEIRNEIELYNQQQYKRDEAAYKNLYDKFVSQITKPYTLYKSNNIDIQSHIFKNFDNKYFTLDYFSGLDINDFNYEGPENLVRTDYSNLFKSKLKEGNYFYTSTFIYMISDDEMYYESLPTKNGIFLCITRAIKQLKNKNAFKFNIEFIKYDSEKFYRLDENNNFTNEIDYKDILAWKYVDKK